MKKESRMLIALLCLTALFMFTACGQGGSGLQSSNDGSTVSTLAKNHLPIADAGLDHSVFSGETVILDGSGSYDPDGDQLTYLWEIHDNQQPRCHHCKRLPQPL